MNKKPKAYQKLTDENAQNDVKNFIHELIKLNFEVETDIWEIHWYVDNSLYHRNRWNQLENLGPNLQSVGLKPSQKAWSEVICVHCF